MIRIEVTSADLAASRFAVSPLLETMHALWTLSGRAEAGPHRAWVARWRGAYARLARRHPGLDAIAAISGNRGSANVDFIAPPPTGVRAAFADELARMRGTPLSLAHAEIERVLARLPRPPSPGVLEILRGPDVVRVIAEAFEAAWTEIVAAEWPRFRAVLERDVVQRAGRLAAYGWGRPWTTWASRCAGAPGTSSWPSAPPTRCGGTNWAGGACCSCRPCSTGGWPRSWTTRGRTR
ncbi:hypothetical protein [Thermocatellispora tengchongensis]|uniref:hypothetical protein n=1 Tax=Thermocatellispora tengchongensis TaxID=1073253 RepID=UPI0036379228